MNCNIHFLGVHKNTWPWKRILDNKTECIVRRLVHPMVPWGWNFQALSRETNESFTTNLYTWRIHTYTRDMTHSYAWHDSSICAAWPFMCVTWLIHMCDVTHQSQCTCPHRPLGNDVSHDSFICVTWLIHMCDMTHWCVWHDTFICMTWLIHMSLNIYFFYCKYIPAPCGGTNSSKSDPYL